MIRPEESESFIQSRVKPLPKENQCSVIFKNLSFQVDIRIPNLQPTFFSKTLPSQKPILQDISGIFKPGRMTAIMGASGAGKTSLLQLLAGNVHFGEIFGEVMMNGMPASQSTIKNVSGFVFQDDVIMGTVKYPLSILIKFTTFILNNN